MKVIHYSKVVNSVLSNYFLRITEANVLSSVSSVVCLHKILILHLPYPIHVDASYSIYSLYIAFGSMSVDLCCPVNC